MAALLSYEIGQDVWEVSSRISGGVRRHLECCYAPRAFFSFENLTKCYLPYTLHSRVLPPLTLLSYSLVSQKGIAPRPVSCHATLGQIIRINKQRAAVLTKVSKYFRAASFRPLRSQSRDDWTNDMPSVQVSHPWLYHGTSGSGTSDEASSPGSAITCGFLTRFGSRLGPYVVGFFFVSFLSSFFWSSLFFFPLLSPCLLLLGRRLLDSGLRPRILGLDINRLLRTCTFSSVYFSHDIYVKDFSDQSSNPHMSRPFSNACKK